jgi:tetratricopeptide (TPR) repeat protein
MKLITTTALTLVVTLSSAPAVGQYAYGSSQQQAQQQQQQTQSANQQNAAQPQTVVRPSGKAMKAIVDLQNTVKKNDLASIPAKVAAAQAVATTKEDRYLIARLQLDAAIAAKDNAAMAASIDAIAASGYLDSGKASSLYQSLGGTFLNEKQYPLAAAAYQKAIVLNPANSEAQGLLGEALFAGGQKAEAAAAFQRAVQARVTAGQKPDEPLIKRAVAVAYEARSPAAVDLARQWVAAYPSTASWSDAIAIYQNLNRPDVEGMVDLLRLMHATGSIKSGGAYAQYARAAAEQNNFNEAQVALDAGIAAKLIDPGKPEYQDLVQGLKTKPKATAADLAEATKSAQSGMALLRIGDRYYAMGDYVKAVELYRMAMGKPGVDSAVANLHIGMALARAGDKAGATAALNAVSGPRAEIAKFWLTYLSLKA